MNNVSNRRFGVEFEFATYPRISWEEMQTFLSDNGYGHWTMTPDGSQFEVKTPILSGANGFKAMKGFLNKIKNGVGAYCTHYDGLHVHHDAPEFIGNRELVNAIVEGWVDNMPEIWAMVAPRRRQHAACPSWGDEEIESLKTISPSWYGGENVSGEGWISTGSRRDLNIRALARHGTIEIRLHEGNLDYDTVASWVKFGQKFIQSVIDGTLEKANTTQELVKKIQVARNASRFLVYKAEKNGEIVSTPSRPIRSW